ncbi:MAG: hypothetical protein V1743_05015 [Nanoarchaeota archaeon]
MPLQLLPGNYRIIKEDSPVAVLTLLDDLPLADEPIALFGQAMTENLGITRVIANLLMNPTIRYLIVCGRDVNGHYPGLALTSLYAHGYDLSPEGMVMVKDARTIHPETREAIAAADPRLPIQEETMDDVMSRFREQITLVNCIGERDVARIHATIEHCLHQEPKPPLQPYEVQLKKREDSRIAITDAVAVHALMRIRDYKIHNRKPYTTA